MTGKGTLTCVPARRTRNLVAAHAAWLASLSALVVWWAWLALRQADRIRELETKLGLSEGEAGSNWMRTHRMLVWEGGFFLLLILLAGGVMAWLYSRDLRRQRGLQAFFASVTHELRTPLTSIRLQAESLADLMGPRPHEDELNLVKRLLELSRVEGGGQVHLRPLRVRPWLDRTLGSWSEAWGDRLEIRVEVPADCAVQADPTALQVVLRNLLENSARHSKRERVKATLSCANAGTGVELVYRDDGPGFHGGDPRKLGEIFEKGESSQGAGVGLYLVRILMERMGGKAEFAGGEGFPVRLVFQAAGGEG
jgi:signal transduction histidine kinase